MVMLTSGLSRQNNHQIDFKSIADKALPSIAFIASSLLPGGKRIGGEWIATNPKRNDKCLGSFKINLKTGKWADFAIDMKGGDLISLAAYLKSCSQAEAATWLSHEFKLEV